MTPNRPKPRAMLYGALFFAFLLGSTLACNLEKNDASGGQVIPPSSGEMTTSGGESMPVEVEPNSPEAELSADESSLLTLSEGEAQYQPPEPLPAAEGEPLTPEEISRILARLPAIQRGEQAALNLPPEPLPPPQTGETIAEPFPAPEEAAPPEPVPVESGPLKVLRYSPEGEVPLAPFVSVTFNQPMIPIATLEALNAAEVPVQIEPQLPGTWRWVGTKTLTFNYDSEEIDRLPMATEYRVTIPAGTQSAAGGVLEETVTFTFHTPPPQVVTTYPAGESQPLEPVFFVAFDQRVEPQAVLDVITVKADGQPVALRLASEDEIAADKTVKALSENALESRWVAFVAAEPLPKDAQITVTIGPDTPSAEGPLTTGEVYTYDFRTYAPLAIEEYGCTWYSEDECPPFSPFFIRFNNAIDPDAYTPEMLRVDPEIPGVRVDIIGNTIQINGETQGRTTYTVFVSKDLQDVFGQTLGKDASLTFKVGPAEPVLLGPSETFITMDPAASEPAVSFYTVNYNKLEVQIYAVQPADWPAFQQYLQDYQYNEGAGDPPGRKVFDGDVPIEAVDDRLVETKISLSDYLDGDYGHFIVVAKPPKGFFEKDRYWMTNQTWVQVTQIGLDAFNDQDEMVVWANALRDGAPLSGVSIRDQAGTQLASTGADGTARFPLPSAGYLVASLGADQAILPYVSWYWSGEGWQQRHDRDTLRWYVFDDRAMYRPGEEVHLKGWLRVIGAGPQGDVSLPGGVDGVYFTVYGPQGNTLTSGRAAVNTWGGFDFAFALPENANLGYATIQLDAEGSLKADGTSYSHSFQIQEFRRPEFEVTARNETTGPYFAGSSATVAVEAAYYAGGPLPNADVVWMVTSTPANYRPPNWDEFDFGVWTPWWRWDGGWDGPIYTDGESETYAGKTDATGTHYLDLHFGIPEDLRPRSVIAEAAVQDVNRQAWASSTSLMVHPASVYVGMRSERYFVEKGQPLEIALILVDVDGNPVPDRPIQVTAARLDWEFREGAWQEVESDLQECTVGSAAEPVTCTFETPQGGEYRITALVSDEQGRRNKTVITRWVSGGDLRPARNVEQEQVILIPDKETYQPGDAAEILVQSPFGAAEGLLTVSRSGILYTERFSVDASGSATLRVPIEEAHIPNLNIQVDLNGKAVRLDDQGNPLPDAPPRPAYASGSLTLKIPPLVRTLDLALTPAETRLDPGGETTLHIALTDAAGNPVPDAELAVVVVDEAILALTNYQMTDPLTVFYQERPSEVESRYARSSIVLVDPMALMMGGRGGGPEDEMLAAAEGDVLLGFAPAMEAPVEEKAAALPETGGGENSAAPIAVRTNFDPLAVFAPSVVTDPNGEARVEIKLPDNLTRYRIMVVAADQGGQRFGSAESSLTARLPLMVRPAAPRFLNFGDQFALPVVLQNQTDDPMTVEVVARTDNLILTGGQGLRVSVPANDRIEVRFPATTDMAGTARVQIAAVSGEYADAAEIELPVYTPATTEAFATYGVVDAGAIRQPVAAPEDVFPQFGGLEIQTSSTALQSLTDAVLYLTSYPFECSEQLASRILGVAALRDVLTAFEAEGLPSPTEMADAVSRDIKRLEAMQNSDGGFPYWQRGDASIPFNTIHVAHALQRAEQKGFAVPAGMKSNVLYYLQDIENRYPAWYSQPTRDFLSAYALYVRHRMGDRDPAKARDLLNRAGLENLDMAAVGWLWQVLLDDPASVAEVDAIRRYVGNQVVETPGAANFITRYDEQSYLLLASDRRTDAILLDAMIADNPQNDLISKVVNGLLAHRTRGRWGNTQENVFVLLALDRYFNTFEAQTPDFVARIWLGETYAGEYAYQGYSTDSHETLIPMAYLTDPSLGGGAAQDVIISKEGAGRLYYRLGLRYAPTDLNLEPLEMGFVVQRVYEAVDDPDDVTRDADGVWHIRAGARVRVRLTMVADSRRYHVALVDPLPAGLEPVNPALAVSGSVPQDPSGGNFRYGWWWWGTWYNHQNLRDERAEAFTPLLWEGVYEYTYIARATTPGTFIVPPAKAEEMYSPEVFGRSGSDVVIVE